MKGNRFSLVRMYQISTHSLSLSHSHTHTHTHSHTELCFFRLRFIHIITVPLLSVLKSEYVAFIQAPHFAKRYRLLMDFYVMSHFGVRLNSMLQL